jgi:hypothetical protein
MVYCHTKNADYGIFWKALGGKRFVVFCDNLVYLLPFWYFSCHFDIFYSYLVLLWPFWNNVSILFSYTKKNLASLVRGEGEKMLVPRSSNSPVLNGLSLLHQTVDR